MGWLMGIRYDQRESQEATRLKNGTFVIHAAYSPDSQWIAFETNNDANYEIGVMRSDGSGRIIITNDPALDFDPVWRPYLP
jgi:Tol biopolymer transport system component